MVNMRALAPEHYAIVERLIERFAEDREYYAQPGGPPAAGAPGWRPFCLMSAPRCAGWW